MTYLVQSSKAAHSPCWKVSISSRFPHRVALSALLSLDIHIFSIRGDYRDCPTTCNKHESTVIIIFDYNFSQFKNIDSYLNTYFTNCHALTCRWLAGVVDNSSALFVVLWQIPAHVPRCLVQPEKNSTEIWIYCVNRFQGNSFSFKLKSQVKLLDNLDDDDDDEHLITVVMFSPLKLWKNEVKFCWSSAVSKRRSYLLYF